MAMNICTVAFALACPVFAGRARRRQDVREYKTEISQRISSNVQRLDALADLEQARALGRGGVLLPMQLLAKLLLRGEDPTAGWQAMGQSSSLASRAVGFRRKPAVGVHMKNEDTKGAIGGAIVGGLLAGPFGAFWGAQLGSSAGTNARAKREQEEQMDRMGLTKEVLEAAQLVAAELAEAEQSLGLVQEAERSQAALVQRLDETMQDMYASAQKALQADDEDGARDILTQRQGVRAKKEAAELELREASKRVAIMQTSVTELAGRATQVEQMMSRSVASRSEINSGSASQPRTASQIYDPLEEKFRDLEK